MEEQGENKLMCQFCKKTYTSQGNWNRHMRIFHPKVVTAELKPKTRRIICPLCSQQESFLTHLIFRKHLFETHNIGIKVSTLNFMNLDEFQVWRTQSGREENYSSSMKHVKRIVYHCIRSNCRGYESKSTTNQPKSGGSKFINGVCPSRIVAKIANTGEVFVEFVETHVGHEDKIGCKSLTKAEEGKIKDQLTAGVTVDRIIHDARVVENKTLKRINLLTRVDLNRIIKKYNIDHQRHPNDIIATALKVEEWNNQGKNNAFLFKNIGDIYDGLKLEDFALGFMSDIMKSKIKTNTKVICIDGTHGTNRKNYELTTVLVKDDYNTGFPIAFLVSNRRDETIIRIFFRALLMKLEEPINCQYIMTDDDPRYYNAWINVMNSTERPRRLLCSWHVIKNWTIQGRNKIKNKTIREEMKNKMRCIMKEMNIQQFILQKNAYFKHLEEEGENEFLKYLQSYYFQSEDRIMMWAHCHRINAGINTNMAIESFNKLLKYNKLKGNCNIRIEKLLDVLEEIVHEKVWKTIINEERPNANSYQHRTIMQAHKKAKEMDGKVQVLECGNFKVESGTVNGKHYIVSANEICDKDCREGYCHICQICLHLYKCQCAENSIKYVLCKHIHAVSLFVQRSESVSGTTILNEDENLLVICEPSSSKMKYEQNVADFIEELTPVTTTDENKPIHLKDNIRGINEGSTNGEQNTSTADLKLAEMFEMIKFCKQLDPSAIDYVHQNIANILRPFGMKTENMKGICQKRKAEKQTYFPNKKMKRN